MYCNFVYFNLSVPGYSMERQKDIYADPNGNKNIWDMSSWISMLFDMCQIHVYANLHSLYHQYSLLSSGVEGFDEHANKSELKALLSPHLCVKIHINLRFWRKKFTPPGVVLIILKSSCFLHMAQHPLIGQGLLIIEDSRSHSGTPRSVISPKHRHLPDNT